MKNYGKDMIQYGERTNKQKSFGYIPSKIDLEKDYVLGGVLSAPFEVLQENGQWLDYLPEFEEQRKEGR